ncbi:hypothetical protein CSA56_06665 [candidate division KSB3 bacterium]|uniref:Patatin n=1 Tax=candidate division KSB3 bacterium TaxID=2044937 RepID=A0A2G6KGM9_9BACT|nr:MAG: hypothetical protein CSA56_06665 [candidate division KSB3 bacterium]
MSDTLSTLPGRHYILCVDDEQAILNQLSNQLEEAFGDVCSFEYAESAEEAFEILSNIERQGDIVLLVISDQVMPGMKGDEFLEVVNRRFPQAHKILLTGYAGLESAMRAINYAGLDRYLEKPWDKEEFLVTVRGLLSSETLAVAPKGFHTREAIRNVQMFRDLPENAIDSIAENLKLVAFQKDEVVFTIDDPGDCLYIIKSGEVKVVAGVGDRGEVLTYLGRGNYFGEMALLTGDPRSASIITTMDSELLMLTKQDFDFLIQHHPSIALALSHMLSQRLREVSIKKAGRQNKIICIFNTLFGQYEQTVVPEIAQSLMRETNGRVFVVDLDPASHQRQLEPEQQEKNAAWVIDHLDNIQDDELSSMLPRYENGVKFFIPPLSERYPLSSYIVRLLSMLKDSYNFVLVHVKADSELGEGEIKIMEQANTVLYLLNQTKCTIGGPRRLLHMFQREYGQLLKKFEVVVARQEPDSAFSELLTSFVEHHRIHFLRVGESLQSFFQLHRRNSAPVTAESAASQARRDVSRIARRLGNVSVGLVLGGGGARAYAHLGVLKVLQEEGIPIDIIAGTSMGAFLGALHIMGYSIEDILDISRDTWKKLNSPLSWTIPRIAFIKGKRIKHLVHDIFGETLIEDLPLPFFCVAGDLVSGQEVVLGSGELYKAILATGALPGFFAPVSLKNMYLVDGGVVNNVPGDVLKKQGVDMVIAVDVTPEREVHLRPEKHFSEQIVPERKLSQRFLQLVRLLKSRYGTVLLPRIIMRVIAIEGLEITRNKSRYFDIHIKPALEDFDLFDFRRLRDIVDIGEEAGRAEIAKIRETISSLKR